MIPQLSSRRVLEIAEWLLLVFLVALFVRSGFLPGWRNLNTDFPNYYIVASLLKNKVPLDQVYDWTWLQRQKDSLGVSEAVAGFAPYPPISALPVLPFTSLSPLAAKRVWLLLNVGFLAAAILFLHLATFIPVRRVAILSFLCVAPLRINLWLGQYYILILLLFCAAYYAYCHNRRASAGGLLALAAALKIFPGLALLLFVAKRDWRAVSGFLVGALALVISSFAIFGFAVHGVYLVEVLPRTFTGDLLSPYTLQWNSFSALWHRLFLIEPQLNPSPLVNSLFLYAFAQAVTIALLLISFLCAVVSTRRTIASAREWALLVILAMLLSPMPAIYHLCVLILAAILGAKALMDASKFRALVAFLILFDLACIPIPGGVEAIFPLRLVVMLALYVLLLTSAFTESRLTQWYRWLAAAGVLIACLFPFMWVSVNGRDRELARRLPTQPVSYRSFDPIATSKQTLFISNVSHLEGYGITSLGETVVHHSFANADVLTIRYAGPHPFLYVDIAGKRSSILRLDSSSLIVDQSFELQAERPSVSPDGRWLAWIQKDENQSSLWLRDTSSAARPEELLANAENILETTVTAQGDIFAAAGNRFSPELVRIERATHSVELIAEHSFPVRFPCISPDGTRIAFTRRELGSWHLVVSSLVNGQERILTTGSCNAFTPFWENSGTLLYASDCGRGLTLTAINRVSIAP